MDGAFLTHSQHMIKLPTQEAVNKFLPPLNLGKRVLHPDNPVSIAPQVNEDWVMELRRQNWEAARRARARSSGPPSMSAACYLRARRAGKYAARVARRLPGRHSASPQRRKLL